MSQRFTDRELRLIHVCIIHRLIAGGFGVATRDEYEMLDQKVLDQLEKLQPPRLVKG